MKGPRTGTVGRTAMAAMCGLVLAGMAGCASNSNYAPVVYHHKTDFWKRPVVAQGDTSRLEPIPGSYRAERMEAELAPQPANSAGARRGGVTSESLEDAAPAGSATYIGGTNDAYPDDTRPLDPPIVEASVQQPAPASAAGALVVTAQPGDTLYGLARAHSADRNAIIAANGLVAPYDLKLGQQLLIPRGEGTYTVKSGDTLYSVARGSGVDVRTMALANNISAPYTLSAGQTLRIPAAGTAPTQIASATAPAGSAGGPLVKPGSQPVPAAGSPAAHKAPSAPTGFAWPAKGQIMAEFGPGEKGQRNDGITIRLPEGAAIRAARGGEVIYVGSELKGFGNLVLVRHENGYVTAYAHASRILVRRGDFVERGQHIADVGRTGDVSEPQLHFEIRKDRKPVDPRRYLPSA